MGALGMNTTQIFGRGRVVAYFSMEIALEPDMPTYSGGLGVLAGDFLRSAADLGIPIIGVTLVHRQGYLRQVLDGAGNQTSEPNPWNPEARLQRLEPTVQVLIEGRPVRVRAWAYTITGELGSTVPVILLDTQAPENTAADQTLTDRLYGGDHRYRLCQEAVLGIGGVQMLSALGYTDVQAYHMNEGHSALLTVPLVERIAQRAGRADSTAEDADALRSACIVTTQTPVPAGIDKFPIDLAEHVLGPGVVATLRRHHALLDGTLNLTHLGLFFSRYINGVAMRHEEISRGMFPGYPISSLSNGVHAGTWTAAPMAALYDRYIPEWRRDNLNLRYAWNVPLPQIMAAHAASKRRLIAEVSQRTGVHLSESVLTVGFARRATTYTRADLLFANLQRLADIVERVGPMQAVFAGSAHPADAGGADVIRNVFRAARHLRDKLTVVYVPNYDMALAQVLVAGCDVWLNTPQKPYEASGTSGMKAALNGVPSLSVLDGWWLEGCVDGVTGWSIGGSEPVSDPAAEADALYDRLEWSVIPRYYRDARGFAQVRRAAIALNGSFFNGHRMVMQYVSSAYRHAVGAPAC